MQLNPNQSERIAGSSFLVTGGAGFIGSHIAECLLNAGARKVRVLDNLVTGHFRNMAPFANHPRFEFINGDIRDVESCKAACRGMDHVIHQAALGSVPGTVKDAVSANNVNVTGFLNMLVVAQAAGVKRFVYASGSPVYGDVNQEQKINKYVNELYADVFARLYGIEVIGMRYSNVFGQRQHPKSSYAADIPTIMMQLMRHEPPALNGSAAHSREFIYIEDVVQAILLAVLTTDPKAVNQVYAITNEERTTLPQLAGYLKEFLGAFDESIANIEIDNDVTPGDADTTFTPYSDEFTQKAKELLGFTPRYSLRNGLLQSAGWYWAYLPQLKLENIN